MTHVETVTLPSVSFFAGLVQGGAEKQAVETAKLLHQKGHRVVFYNYNLQKAFYHPEQEIEVVDIKNYVSPFPEPVDKVLSIFRLARIIRHEQPDFLVSYSTLLNVLNGLISLLNISNRKTRHIGSERNSVLRYTQGYLWRVLCRIFYHGLAALYANNSPAVEQLQNLIGIEQERTFLIPNILDTDYFQAQAETKPANDTVFSILVPARVCEQKNQAILIPVAAKLLKTGYRIRFVLAGNPEQAYTSKLKQQIVAAYLEDSFAWIGQQENIRYLYSTSDLVLLPSKFEGFSNSFIEAMACEAIVMGSNIPSFTDVIQDGVNGFIIDISQPDSIASKIEFVMHLDAGVLRDIRHQARSTVLEYGPEGYYQRFMKMLEEVGKT